jgi:hypothetical protein
VVPCAARELRTLQRELQIAREANEGLQRSVREQVGGGAHGARAHGGGQRETARMGTERERRERVGLESCREP